MNRYEQLKHYVKVIFKMERLGKFAKKLMSFNDETLKIYEGIDVGGKDGIKGENYWFEKIILAYIDRLEDEGTEVTPQILTKVFNLKYVAKYGTTPPELYKKRNKIL